ncbi:ABC transporter permease [Halomicroarcula sp. F27]|uniref:ABC transporter permease n=2 Tax=Haloarcula nitratireducens TaxID=2487749 RepID=A0AAW4PC72_9EURY|nr:ABC transporter permease [Halomicroarcula nitratireducens]
MDESDEPSEPPRFQRVEWAEIAPRRRRATPERIAFALGVAVVLGLFLYDAYVAHVYLVGSWEATPVDWAVMLAAVCLAAYGVVPAIQRPRSARRVIRAVRTRTALLGSAAALGLVAVLGLVAAPVLGEPSLAFNYAYQPPVGFTARIYNTGCLGEVLRGPGITRYCRGTLYYPLGTNYRGQPLDYLLISGARTAVYVVAFTAAFIVPLATAVGVAAGLRGGRLDDLLMAYVDVQVSVPALFLYFVGYMYFGPSLLLLLLTFGLLSWGGIARLVRSEVLQRREDGYVRLAHSLGASDRYLATRHVLPNVTNTLVPAVFHLFAVLVVAEAGVAFLGFSDIERHSWGSTIAEGLSTDPMYPHEVWWVSTVPALALAATVVAFKLAGDGLRDAFDPRTEN